MQHAIDFSVAYWLSRYYHAIGIVSFTLDILSIYLILFKSDKIDHFRYFLLNFQVSCSLTDFHLTFLIQPVPLYPLLSGYIMGFGVHFGANLAFGINGVACLVTYQIGSMIICFVRKHQVIAAILHRYVIPKVFIVLMLIYFLAYLITVPGFLSTLSVHESLKWSFIRKNYPELVGQFETLPNFSIYEFSSDFLIFIVGSTLGGMLAFSIFVVILLSIFRMLTRLKRIISASNYRKHRAAIWSLLAQFATSSVIFVPPIVCTFIIIMKIDGSQRYVESFLMIACLHSSLNVVVLIITCPPYKCFFMEFIYRKQKPARTGLSIISLKHTAFVSHFGQ